MKGLETEQQRNISSTRPQASHHPNAPIPNIPLFEIVSSDNEQISADRAELQERYEKIQRILSQADLNNMTPLQALQFLAKVKEEI